MHSVTYLLTHSSSNAIGGGAIISESTEAPLVGGLIVRIKRKRSTDPVEAICIIEDDTIDATSSRATKKSNIIDEFASLTTKNEESSNNKGGSSDSVRRKIVLRRINTISNEVALIESDIVANAKRTLRDNDDESLMSKQKKKYMFTTKGKKSIKDQSNSYVVVDMNQLDGEPDAINVKNVAVKKAGATILDPASRKLDEGIKMALDKNDFTLMNEGLKIGGNVDYQANVTDGSYTCLMAAAIRGNARMVKTLLTRGANSLLKDAKNRTALDAALEVKNGNNFHMMEITMLLKNAMVKHVHTYNKDKNERNDNEKIDEDCVVDIFVMDVNEAGGSDEPINTDDASMQTVQVDGLKIHDDGNVELIYMYDSDWSDLADDEEPDSNDERYYGNDYPDEESSDHNSDGDDDYYDSDEGEKRFPRYHQNNVGRVMRPGIAESNTAKSKESLKQIWGEEDDDDNDDDEDYNNMLSGNEPLKSQRDRIKLIYDNKNKEFTNEGLAKYGVDLSDDENDEEHLMQSGYLSASFKMNLPKDTVAFDSDLDLDTSDVDM